MKAPSCTLMASVVAASTAALSSSAPVSGDRSNPNDVCGPHLKKAKSGGDSSEEKFAPRFDGLRFIETLVTAHR